MLKGGTPALDDIVSRLIAGCCAEIVCRQSIVQGLAHRLAVHLLEKSPEVVALIARPLTFTPQSSHPRLSTSGIPCSDEETIKKGILANIKYLKSTCASLASGQGMLLVVLPVGPELQDTCQILPLYLEIAKHGGVAVLGVSPLRHIYSTFDGNASDVVALAGDEPCFPGGTLVGTPCYEIELAVLPSVRAGRRQGWQARRFWLTMEQPHAPTPRSLNDVLAELYDLSKAGADKKRLPALMEEYQKMTGKKNAPGFMA